MIPPHVESNQRVLKFVSEALHADLFHGQGSTLLLRGQTKENTFKVTEEKLDWEIGAIYFTWCEKQWRVDDHWHVELKTDTGYMVNEACVLMKFLLRSRGEIAEAKSRLFEIWPEVKESTPADSTLGYLVHCAGYKKP